MIVISLLRALLGSLVFGGVTAAMYSVAGAILSCAMMIFAKKAKVFSIFGVSLLGSIGHNVGQILVACFFLSSAAPLTFLPALLIVGAITSIIIAEGAKYVILGIEAVEERQ
jgi:heptaprenyl diphosphate synthase